MNASPGTPRRVVITGIGCVTPIGTGVDGLRSGLRRRRSAVRAIDRFDASPFRSRIAAQVDDFDPLGYMGRKRARRLDRFAQFAVAASRMALEDGDLAGDAVEGNRAAIQMGTALGGVAYAEGQLPRYLEGGVAAVDPLLALSVFAGSASCNVAIELGFTGANATNGMSCASGAMAIGDAWRIVGEGEADVALAGGVEAPLAPLCFGSFAIIRAMSTRNDDPPTASRPFDRGRDGFVMAEGAAVLLLEERERAVSRGARIYAEISGYGQTNDAYHMTAPRPDGAQAARAMRIAMRRAGTEPGEIDYVNVHGSSTPLNDATEAAIVREVLGERTSSVSVGGTKGYHGHALGATGAIEAAITALAILDEWIPPTLNLFDPDDGCDLPFARGNGVTRRVGAAISNSFGFGGINAALVFRRHE